ncbi:phosphate starvation-inducible protein PhoH [Capnocytophaga canimorsus]|uniref:PhoH family protein n=1 Tax=Capnocytophaga canimorsus TaxID=28188 RepID=UPI000D6E182A|nr:PhoH family protein [Capnocytophaga canimorsus]AWL78094.1 phosphate starvation-inducible protein PhoH [Capnocytophaga canimorsus]MDT9499407.1 PhoH family protein [Capnocytophaga canimorsus]
MNEIILELTDVSPQQFFGESESNIKKIKEYFPKLKIVARGNKILAFGEELLLKEFEEKITALVSYLGKYNQLDERAIEGIFASGGMPQPEVSAQNNKDVIVHGVGGKIIRPQTKNQTKLVDLMQKNDMVFAVGPAGTGKTYTGVALAVKALKEKQVKRIILTRPAVEAGENLGFLPGDLKEKLDPYMQPLYDALRDMIPHEKLAGYLETGVIQIAPLAFMRGRTLDNAFVILDEAQNTTHAQMKMFLTRMGRNAKFMITGDPGQVDLPRRVTSGLKEALLILRNVKGIGILHLDDKDVIRHPLVRSIIESYKNVESGN